MALGSLGRIRRRRWWLCWRLEPWALANGLWLIPGLIGSGSEVLRGNLKIVVPSERHTVGVEGALSWAKAGVPPSPLAEGRLTVSPKTIEMKY